MNSELLQYHPTFKSLTGRNLMEFTFQDEEEVISYQLEMITNNHVPGLMKSEVIRVDGEIKLSFDITSLIPMKKFFERREIRRDDFLHILKQIIALLEVLEEYLLDSGGVVFDSQFIFLNPQDLHMEFAYYPIREIPQTLESLKILLLETIIHDIRFINEPSDNFVQKLIELLKTQEFKVSTLQSYVKDMEILVSPAMPKSFNKDPFTNGMYPEKMEEKEQNDKTTIPPQSVKVMSQKESVKVTKIGYPPKSYMILGSVVTGFILLGLALSFTETLSINNPDFLLSLLGYLMIGGALTYLVYSKLFTSEKRTERIKEKKTTLTTQSKPQKSTFYMPSQRITSKIENMPIQVPPKNMEYVNKAFAVSESPLKQGKVEAAPTQQARTVKLGQSMPDQPWQSNPQVQPRDRTVILDGSTMKHPSLKGIQGNSSETIIVTHFPFMLGRLEEQVDYCLKNPAIGKLHAEIKKTSEGFFLADMNSRNGTLINGERIEPSQDYKLENGALITFANEEFIFCEGREDKQT